ncbi:MAG TPA: NAD-dependent epimerase/dehydratase family protein [Armatimonadota bacterium]
MPESIAITGAAGFIGSHLVDYFLAQGRTVTGLDNFSRGTRANLASALQNTNFRLIEVDLADPRASAACKLDGVAEFWHLAANSDIPAGTADAAIDLRDTFLTTCHTLELVKRFSIGRLCFASTSAVYGDLRQTLDEDSGPLWPISNYGAMKLASEAAISAAVESAGFQALIFRFPNVVGSRATHGILFDLIGRIARGGITDLEVLGDGSQRKPYLHVSDLLAAMLHISARASGPRSCYLIGPPDDGITVREIVAAILAECARGLAARYTGGARGWVGDVPQFQYSVAKLAALGWTASMSSGQAIERAVREIYAEMKQPCS